MKRKTPVDFFGTAENVLKSIVEKNHIFTITTQYRHTIINKKLVLKFQKAGLVPLKNDKKGSYYVARGKHWDCVDYCKLELRGINVPEIIQPEELKRNLENE